MMDDRVGEAEMEMTMKGFMQDADVVERNKAGTVTK
jgi:hypothetical protein